MIRVQTNGLVLYEFGLFRDHEITHGVFTRNGGISPSPWNSLNLGGLSGDSRENIIENRKRIFSCFDLPVESIFDVWQVHGNTIIYTKEPRNLKTEHQKADAIFTDTPGITLFMRFADCVPIFFHDIKKKVIGIAHAGRIGTINRIAADCIAGMIEDYGSNPEDILACIGPSIGPDHYEVKNDVIQDLQVEFENYSDFLVYTSDGKKYLDLWKTNEFVLRESGVSHIETARICTACHTEEWFSHRSENGQTGRFGALISLKRNA